MTKKNSIYPAGVGAVELARACEEDRSEIIFIIFNQKRLLGNQYH